MDFDYLEDSKKYFLVILRVEISVFYSISLLSIQPLALVDKIQIHNESSSMIQKTTD